MAHRTTRRSFTGIAVVTAIALVPAATVSSTTDPGSSTVSPMTLGPLDRASCRSLEGLAIPAASIGMPTDGAAVSSSTLIERSESGSVPVPDHCLVSGEIRPVDQTAPSIMFQVALPIEWNGNVVMFGGEGLNGTIPDVVANPLNTPDDSPTPLARGYAVFASDSGHQGEVLDASFALNEEAYLNYVGDALKKTRDASLFIIDAVHGRVPQRSYFLGSSTGGREALTVAGRWPADWDGVVSLYPARNLTARGLGMIWTSRVLAEPGAYLNESERGVLRNAALEACDELDGVADGLISAVDACNDTFDPATASVEGALLRCPDGRDTADTCLADAQIEALEALDSGVAFEFTLASGDTGVPGWNVYTSDTGVQSDHPVQELVRLLAFGSTPPDFPVSGAMPLTTLYADAYARYFVARDESFNFLDLDPTNPGRLAPRLDELAALDTADLDLGPFAEQGGKVLLMQGTADLLISARDTEAYYRQLQDQLGAGVVDSFLRFYLVPEFGHSASSTFQPSWDQLTALERWVEDGVDPNDGEVVTDATGVPGRTRPLCQYPGWPHYRGSGDVNDAAAFDCVAR